MNITLEAHVATIHHFITLWSAVRRDFLSVIRLQKPEGWPEDDQQLSYPLAMALVGQIENSQATQTEATQQVLTAYFGHEVTLLQVQTLLRFLNQVDEFNLLDVWRLDLKIDRDGYIWALVGGISMVHDRQSWRLDYGGRQLDLHEAIGMAVTIAARHPRRY